MLNEFYVYICTYQSQRVMKIRAKIENPSKKNRIRRITKHELSIQATAMYWAKSIERMAYGRFAILNMDSFSLLK